MATSAATITPDKMPEVKPVDGFLALALVAVLAVCVRAIWFTPVDAMLGAAQKIFYVHVPSA
ncbi:MAG: cytochrome C assembly protein, partial [Gemmatimonas sp.]